MMSIAYDHGHEATPIAASKPRLLLIDGQRVASLGGRTFETLNPATEQVIATIAEGNEVDVDRAVAAARRALRARGARCVRPNAATSCSGWSS
jgi:aldehyde dehydrogenase (NAD+)